MFQTLLTVWEWIKGQAIATIIFLALITATLFVYLGFHPITIELKGHKTENFVQFDSVTCYVFSTTWEKDGAKLSIASNSVTSRVEDNTQGETND